MHASPHQTPDRPELFVLRHGRTEWNAAGRHQGRRDSPLTAEGREQAAAQGAILQGLGLSARVPLACYTSPQPRASDTAGIALGAIGRTAQPDPRLCEVDVGEWEGLTSAEIDARAPGLRAREGHLGWHFHSPGGESFDAICARVGAFLDTLEGPSVVVTHGITGRVLRGLWLGLDIAGMNDLPGGQGVVFRLASGRHEVLRDPG